MFCFRSDTCQINSFLIQIDSKIKFCFPQVVALQHCCSYKPCLPELSVQGDAPVSGLVEEEQVGVDSWLLLDLSDVHEEKLMQHLL